MYAIKLLAYKYSLASAKYSNPAIKAKIQIGLQEHAGDSNIAHTCNIASL